ncbi:membrane protein insertase YidC [Clostridium tagluense]|uniref:membrane protein insertase YidC n=1 Tax=Clostridium TaxID=1485 RepID=UPI0013E989C3|nr:MULTISPECIES: membrane protein insertase YidC [Clostridium]MBU3128326.1 membrane protein insertase YidC [Clostridium tagluense]MBW9157616.1 membrane protein insertase YidC [Clostridium tagluense]MBZ9622697.1 membrane protein insertase YidC [Clostridium sp. FP2]MCB2310811.1 membrane protein insertase YidC [Clostridium tagluense]MCB2315459.1 membrane protein insertase YidC [Clostridium tagluense]
MNIIFNFLSGLLNSIFNFTGDWGLAIVLLTLVVRLVLSPMSFKQKKSMQQQQRFAIKMKEIKEKYKDNKEKLEEAVKKQSTQSAKSMMGCLVTLLQLPILMTMWSVFNKIPVDVGTYLIPWVSSIKISDSYFVVPLIYVIVLLTPSLLSYVTLLKIEGQAKISKSSIIVMAVGGLFVAKAAPIAVGIYLITTSVFNFLEELVFRMHMRNLKTEK